MEIWLKFLLYRHIWRNEFLLSVWWKFFESIVCRNNFTITESKSRWIHLVKYGKGKLSVFDTLSNSLFETSAMNLVQRRNMNPLPPLVFHIEGMKGKWVIWSSKYSVVKYIFTRQLKNELLSSTHASFTSKSRKCQGYLPLEQMLEVSGWPELSVSLSWTGFECKDKSLGPGLGDLPLMMAVPSVGPLRMSVIMNRDLVAAVCGMALASSCTVMPVTVLDTFSPTPNTLTKNSPSIYLVLVQSQTLHELVTTEPPGPLQA